MKGNNTETTNASEPLGLTALGNWRECPAMQMAFERGSMVFEEGDLCQEIGIVMKDLAGWIAEHWREHSINAVAHGQDEVGKNNLTIVRQCGHYFEARLFSPLRPDSPMVQDLRRLAIRPQTM